MKKVSRLTSVCMQVAAAASRNGYEEVGKTLAAIVNAYMFEDAAAQRTRDLWNVPHTWAFSTDETEVWFYTKAVPSDARPILLGEQRYNPYVMPVE